MPAKIQRWIDLIATLLAHRAPVTFEEIEREVPGYQGKARDAKKRMFERDKRDLKAFGVPIESVGEEGSEESAYRLRTKDFYLPYLSVTTARGTSRPRRVDRYGYHALTALAFEPDELAAVAEGAARARMLGDPDLAGAADSAMRKLAFDLPVGAVSAPDESRIVASRARPDPKVLERLGAALLARKWVEAEYRSMSADTVSRRRLEPYGLFFLNAHWYLAARDVAKDELRNFRVSRISSVRANTAREDSPDYEIPASFRLRDHARSRHPWELGEGDVLEATVEFRGASGAAAAAASLGAPVKGEPRRRTFTVRRLDAFARWLLSFAGEAVPVAPEAVIEELRREVAATRALYARDGEVGGATR